jgi:hypothetical protein
LTRVLLIGSGKRVVEAALPVFRRAEGYEVAGIVSRTPKAIVSENTEFQVQGLDSLTNERLSEVDLVYMVVAKHAVPGVLRRLEATDRSRFDLLIETPVMLVRHLGHRGLLEGFRETWVSEDCITLPCFDAAHAFFQSGAAGELEGVTFDRSAYAYHGVAMVKAVLGGSRVHAARQRQLGGGSRERSIRLAEGRTGTIRDPRDYALGSMTFHGARGDLTDREAPGAHRIEAIVEDGKCIGFRAGDERRELNDLERELMGPKSGGAGMTAWMDGMKRVGFLALADRIRKGAGAYSLSDAVEDSVVDYFLEKLGRYRATPFTRPDAGPARLAFSLLTRIAGR